MMASSRVPVWLVLACARIIAQDDHFAFAETTITLTGTPQGGDITIICTLAPNNGKFRARIRTAPGESAASVAERVAKLIPGRSGSFVSGTKIQIDNSILGRYAVLSTDPGLVFPGPVVEAKATFDEAQGHVRVTWKKPLDVARVVVVLESTMLVPVVGDSFLDKFSDKRPQRYLLVSVSKDGNPGAYVEVVYPPPASEGVCKVPEEGKKAEKKESKEGRDKP